MNWRADCAGTLAAHLSPRRRVTVSQWADDHRILSGKQAAERGRWRTRRNPMLAEIMDCFSAGSGVRDLVVMKSSQVGMTEAVVNVVGYTIAHAPCPMMIMMPSLEARDAWKAQKLNPLFTDTPALREIIGGARARDGANRQDYVDFPGGILFLAGGNSANSYAQRSVRVIILDDLDRFPEEIGAEGDVVTLAEGRTKAFPRAIRAYISTPTIKDGLIHRLYQTSDQRRYHVPCPHCGEHHPLDFGGPDVAHGLKWTLSPSGEISHVRYVCRGCGAEIDEGQKPLMLAEGRWIASRPAARLRGYHLSALYAPIGLGPSWKDLAQGWLAAQANTATLRAFINTQLGEPWEERGEEADPLALLARVEDGCAAPAGAVRVVGIDVQKDRIEASFFDVGAGEEMWAVDHLIVAGDTAGRHPWEELDAALREYAPRCGAIDSGYATDAVLAFAAKRPWLYVAKGIEGRGKPLVESDEDRRRRLRKRARRGFSPFLVSDEAAKLLLMQRLKIDKPGPGCLHYPKSPAFDDEYFAQLASNRLVEKTMRGRLVREWQQTRVRNEAFDCWKYALAGFRLARIEPSPGGAKSIVARPAPRYRIVR